MACAPCPFPSTVGLDSYLRSVLCWLRCLITLNLLTLPSVIALRFFWRCSWATVNFHFHLEALLKFISLQIQRYLFFLPLSYLKGQIILCMFLPKLIHVDDLLQSALQAESEIPESLSICYLVVQLTLAGTSVTSSVSETCKPSLKSQ